MIGRVPETVMQRALREFPLISEDTARRMERINNIRLRRMAPFFLKDQGVNLVGDPTVVGYAIDKAMADLAETEETRKQQLAKPRRGRPRNDFHTWLIYAAAWTMYLSAGSAAQFLGEPATRDKVQKGLAAYLEYASARVTLCDGSATVREFMCVLIADAVAELRRISDELATEQRARSSRRYSSCHASFFGADGRATVPLPECGDDDEDGRN